MSIKGVLRLVIIAAILTAPAAGSAQVYEAWVQRYDGPGNLADEATAIHVDGAGNVYVTGYSVRDGTQTDYMTLKYSANGALLWEARYNGTGNSYDYARAIGLDGAGNVYVSGESAGADTYPDFVTVKYDPNGVELWSHRHGETGIGERVYGMAIDAGGNAYVAGGRPGENEVVKYNNEGIILWILGFIEPGSEEYAIGVRVDAQGHVYVARRSRTEKYDPDSSPIWSITDDIVGGDLWVDTSGLVCRSGTVNGRIVTAMYDSGGVQLWSRELDPPGTAQNVAAVRIDRDSNVCITGTAFHSVTGNDYITLKYSPLGILEWERSYDWSGKGDNANALGVDSAGNIYVTGASSQSSLFHDYATIKYSPDGERLWVGRYRGPAYGEDGANALAVDSTGNVYVTGHSAGIGTRWDMATIKYAHDSLPPNVTVGVLQNPLLPAFVDIHIVADESLESAPTLLIDGAAYDPVSVSEDATHFVYGPYHLDGSGTVQLEATCRDRALNEASVTTVFESFPVGIAGALWISADRQLHLAVPEHAVSQDRFFLLFHEADEGGPIYDLRPHSTQLARRAELRIDCSPSAGNHRQPLNLGISRQAEDGTWEPLPTFYDSETGTLVAQINRLGRFQVRAGSRTTLLPRTQHLQQNYPNPFNAGTIIRFSLEQPQQVTLEVFNVLGQHVATLIDGQRDTGTHMIAWDGRGSGGGPVASGLYYYRLGTASGAETRAMVVLR